MRRVLLVLLVPALLAACGGDEEREPLDTVAPEEEGAGAEAIQFGSALAQIRGHFQVATELLDAGDAKNALAQARRPLEELQDFVVHELEEHDPDSVSTFTSLLERAPVAVKSGDPVEILGVFDDATIVTSNALRAVVGQDATTPAYRGSVIASLLSTAAHEYDEANAGPGIVNLDEYRDAYAFFLEAERLYGEIGPKIEADEPAEAEEIEEAFAALAEALPAAEPPDELVPVKEVESAASLIGHELEETVDAAPVKESDPEEVVANIEHLLDEVVAAYEAGDADEASELAAEAYLENYEVIEADVIEYAPEVNEELEPLLGADLRRQIDAGVPAEEIEAMTAHAKELLADALAALEGAHE